MFAYYLRRGVDSVCMPDRSLLKLTCTQQLRNGVDVGRMFVLSSDSTIIIIRICHKQLPLSQPSFSSLRHLVCFLKSHFTSRYRYTTGGQFAKCCGSKSYNYQTHLCCYNYVVPRHGGPDAKCCGPTSYNHKDSICCSGKVVPRIGGGRTGCCGKQSYSINKEICCESGKVIKLYAPGGTHARCCGQYSYNFLTHICCNGKVLRRQAGCFTKCCGQVRAQLF